MGMGGREGWGCRGRESRDGEGGRIWVFLFYLFSAAVDGLLRSSVFYRDGYDIMVYFVK